MDERTRLAIIKAITPKNIFPILSRNGSQADGFETDLLAAALVLVENNTRVESKFCADVGVEVRLYIAKGVTEGFVAREIRLAACRIHLLRTWLVNINDIIPYNL